MLLGRVLITPPVPISTNAPAAPRKEFTSSESPQVSPSVDEALAEELPACSCYAWFPSACTALLRDWSSGKPVARCGAQVNSIVIPPDSCQGGYYGHDASLLPESVLEHGLPTRGSDWDLIRHVEQTGNSAFRGTTKLVTYPGGGGAAAWADEGGFVYEVTCVPSWDVQCSNARTPAYSHRRHTHTPPSRRAPEHPARCR